MGVRSIEPVYDGTNTIVEARSGLGWSCLRKSCVLEVPYLAGWIGLTVKSPSPGRQCLDEPPTSVPLVLVTIRSLVQLLNLILFSLFLYFRPYDTWIWQRPCVDLQTRCRISRSIRALTARYSKIALFSTSHRVRYVSMSRALQNSLT